MPHQPRHRPQNAVAQLTRPGIIARLYIEKPNPEWVRGITTQLNDPRTGNVTLWQNYQGTADSRFGSGFWNAWDNVVNAYILANF